MGKGKRNLIDKISRTTTINGKTYNSMIVVKCRPAVQIYWLDLESGDIQIEFRWPAGEDDYISTLSRPEVPVTGEH